LQAVDVIAKLDGERVRSVGELRGMLAGKRTEKSVTLTILRKACEISISVEPQAPNPPNPALDVTRHVSMSRVDFAARFAPRTFRAALWSRKGGPKTFSFDSPDSRRRLLAFDDHFRRGNFKTHQLVARFAE
jgi:hypothetical protein